MALIGVEMTSEVFRTCVGHALTTEAEEVMGLLLGDITYDNWGRATARLWAAMPQIRTDRRKDRVEASPEQLARASALAERLTEDSGQTTRVVGWYHSHPHITVLPSHVDVRTQAMYQTMDAGFVGLIYSVFNQDGDRGEQIQMTAFQSEQQGAQSFPSQRGSWDFDSPMAAAISASMEEARKVAYHEGRWVHRRVPVRVTPSSRNRTPSLESMSTICRVLFEEEQHTFRQAIADATDSQGYIDPLTALHHAAEYHQHLARLVELVASPALQSLRAGRVQSQWQQQQARDLRDLLHHRSHSTGADRQAGNVQQDYQLPSSQGQASGSSLLPSLSGQEIPQGYGRGSSQHNVHSLYGDQASGEALSSLHPDFSQAKSDTPASRGQSANKAALGEPSQDAVKVTLTEWIGDQLGEVPAAPLPSRESDADLTAAIEASRLTAPGPFWDAQVLDEKDRNSSAENLSVHSHASGRHTWPDRTDWDDDPGSHHTGDSDLAQDLDKLQMERRQSSEGDQSAVVSNANARLAGGPNRLVAANGNQEQKNKVVSGGQPQKHPNLPVDPFRSLLDHASVRDSKIQWSR